MNWVDRCLQVSLFLENVEKVWVSTYYEFFLLHCPADHTWGDAMLRQGTLDWFTSNNLTQPKLWATEVGTLGVWVNSACILFMSQDLLRSNPIFLLNLIKESYWACSNFIAWYISTDGQLLLHDHPVNYDKTFGLSQSLVAKQELFLKRRRAACWRGSDFSLKS